METSSGVSESDNTTITTGGTKQQGDDGTSQQQQQQYYSSPSCPLHIFLDAGYGLPREARPRQEKILAIAKQIVNFLKWQQQQQQQQSIKTTTNNSNNNKNVKPAPVTVIGCTDDTMKQALLERLEQLWTKEQQQQQQQQEEEEAKATISCLPDHFSFADKGSKVNNVNEESTTTEKLLVLQDAIYLSPDAPYALDPSRPPPNKVIVGLLIDRRIQLNRSLQRAQQLQLPAKRWPIEALDLVLIIEQQQKDHNQDHAQHGQQQNKNGTDTTTTPTTTTTGSSSMRQHSFSYHAQEPLNVDTILEALQQWSWNWNDREVQQEQQDEEPFQQASFQAFQRHAQRHPARPQHRTSTGK